MGEGCGSRRPGLSPVPAPAPLLPVPAAAAAAVRAAPAPAEPQTPRGAGARGGAGDGRGGGAAEQGQPRSRASLGRTPAAAGRGARILGQGPDLWSCCTSSLRFALCFGNQVYQDHALRL